MTMQLTDATPLSRFRWLRSTGAVLAGLASIVVLSTAADHVLHVTGVYPPYGEPMRDHALFAFALAYRTAFGVLAGFITAWLAPNHKVRHAVVLGTVGVLLSTLGAVAMWDYGLAWYNIALIVVAVPAAWLGAKLYLGRTV